MVGEGRMQRWIIHVDMDAFFAAVEQRDNPALVGKPVIVGGLGQRGVVSTASYEARRFGVHSAMPMTEARRLCPQGTYLAGNHQTYQQVSRQLQSILADYSPLIETLSLDEAFLDVSGMEWLFPDVVEIARQIKTRIAAELRLTASAGVAPNKFLAKLASDLQKPDGLVVIRPGEEAALLRRLPIERLWGVGSVTAQRLRQLGAATIGQLAELDPQLLEQHCGKGAYDFQRLARGWDDRPVVPGQPQKSIGREITYEQDLVEPQAIGAQLLYLAEKVGRRLRRHDCGGRTVTLKVRFASFRTVTRSKTLPEPTNLDDVLYEIAVHMYNKLAINEGIRLLGISVSQLATGSGQVSLFADQQEKKHSLYQVVDKLRDKFGDGIVTKGRLLHKEKLE